MSTHSNHRIFISWSGITSQKIATAIRDWISIVIQHSNPFMSQSDIDPGSRSMAKLGSELENMSVGLLCVTPGNQDSRWLNFEAGAISKQIDDSRVVPILFDLEPGQLSPPLSLFQAVKIDDEEAMMRVAQTINSSFASQALDSSTLERSFRIAWQELQRVVGEIKTVTGSSQEKGSPKRTIEDMFEEVVVTMRDVRAGVEDLTDRPSRSQFADLQLELSNKAIRKVAASHGRREIKDAVDLVEISELLDEEDWLVVDSAPFLRWYLEVYHGVIRPTDIPDENETDINDVPF